MDTASLIALVILSIAVLSLITRLWVVNKRTEANPHSDHDLLVDISETLESIQASLVDIHNALVELKVHTVNIWNEVNK